MLWTTKMVRTSLLPALFALVIIMPIGSVVSAQACGPNCPICSGSGSNTETMLSSRTIFTSVLYFQDAEETFITNFKLALSSRFDVGVGYLNQNRDVIWNARALLLAEENGWPAVIAGIGSVKANASDQSAFITATRSLEDDLGKPIRISLGMASYLSGSKKTYLIWTLSFLYRDKLFPFISSDGLNINYGVSYFLSETMNLGVLRVENRYLGMMLGYRFTL